MADGNDDDFLVHDSTTDQVGVDEGELPQTIANISSTIGENR